MNTEDDEFNRIEREAAMRKAAVSATVAKREWVGLTNEEIEDLFRRFSDLELLGAIEELLRSKNT
jgi:hypothetical protein